MFRRQLTAIAIVGALSAAPLQAQLAVTVSGGATMPLGDYDKYASTGWIGTLGLLGSVGDKGIRVGAELFYGNNPHSSEVDGDKSVLTGMLGTLQWRIGDKSKAGVFLVGNLGYMKHKITSELFPSIEGSDDGLAYGAGAGLVLPKGRATWYLIARYLTADIENATTSLAPLTLGVSFPLTTKN